MTEFFKKCLIGQFGASLSVLNDCVVQCPDDTGKHRSAMFGRAASRSDPDRTAQEASWRIPNGDPIQPCPKIRLL